MKRTILFALALALGSIAANAADKSAEFLSVAPYPADTPWKKISEQRDARVLWIEWIPADQDVSNISDILTEQIFFDVQQSPEDFVAAFLRRIADACRRASHNGPTPGVENGYPVAYAQTYCVGQKGADKDVDIFVKAIRGRDALYVVQREFRRPAVPDAVPGETHFTQEQLPQAKAALEAHYAADNFLVGQVQLCPLATGDGPCPAAAPPPKTPPPVQQGPPPPADDGDVSSAFGFTPGKTTAKEVRAKFGTSDHQTRMGDEHTYLYEIRGVIVVFLFDGQDILIRTRAYTQR